jgi:hypothetical protein
MLLLLLLQQEELSHVVGHPHKMSNKKKHTGHNTRDRDNNWNAVAQSRRELHYDRFVWTKSEMKKMFERSWRGGND